jgi:hypothetical protein
LTDALTHQFDDPSKFVRLYALVGRLRLFASAMAEEVMQDIIETCRLANQDFSNPEDRRRDEVDVPRAFSETCRLGIQVAFIRAVRW